jgi:hypothetical protein
MWMTLPANVGFQPSNRLLIFNSLVQQVAATRDWLSIVDYASYIREHDEWRPDGIHLSETTSLPFVEAWLADQINELALATSS